VLAALGDEPLVIHGEGDALRASRPRNVSKDAPQFGIEIRESGSIHSAGASASKQSRNFLIHQSPSLKAAELGERKASVRIAPPSSANARLIECWVLDVRCWVFSVECSPPPRYP